MSALTFLILGGDGDLARRLLIPGLAQYLEEDPHLDVTVIGVGIAEPKDYCGAVNDALVTAGAPQHIVDRLLAKTSWATADATSSTDLEALLATCTGRTIMYFALSPRITKLAVDALATIEIPPAVEFALEKPFGTDAKSARALNKVLYQFADENDIVRSDHFLGMSGTANLGGLLETNRPLQTTWDNGAIASLTFVYDETLGLEGRAQFYDFNGAARDMLQSHLLQVMARSLADPADGPEGAAKVLAATSLAADVQKTARRARYTTGQIEGHALPDYTSEDGVDPSRGTETIAQVTLAVDTDGWRGVPITLRSGKAVGDPRQEITINYLPVGNARGTTLRLAFREDAVFMEVNVSDPGSPQNLQRVTLHTKLVPSRLSAYGRVARALILKSGATELHADSPIRAWEILQPVFDAFADGSIPLEEYPAGSPGPKGW